VHTILFQNAFPAFPVCYSRNHLRLLPPPPPPPLVPPAQRVRVRSSSCVAFSSCLINSLPFIRSCPSRRSNHQAVSPHPLHSFSSHDIHSWLHVRFLTVTVVGFSLYCILERSSHKGIIVYIEYQSFCPFVGIGSPHLLPRNRVYPPPIWVLGGATLACGGGGGGTISDEVTDTLVLYVYCIYYNPSTGAAQDQRKTAMGRAGGA
jgi:hypothetical protein